MLPLRYAGYWRTASVILLFVVLVSTLMPAVWFWSDRVSILRWIEDVDKWAHALTFALLAIWFAGLYRPRSYWRIATGLLLFGVLIEICQRLVGYRTADWFDVGADLAGIAVGIALALAGLGGWSLRLEERLVARHSTARRD